MRYSFTVFIIILGLFLFFSGSVFRYRAFLAITRFFHGGYVFDYETMRVENAALKNALSVNDRAASVSADKNIFFANLTPAPY